MSADNSICTGCHFKTAYPKWKKTRPEIFPFMKSWIVKKKKKKEDGNGITVPILPASTNNKNEKERKETDTESLQL